MKIRKKRFKRSEEKHWRKLIKVQFSLKKTRMKSFDNYYFLVDNHLQRDP